MPVSKPRKKPPAKPAKPKPEKPAPARIEDLPATAVTVPTRLTAGAHAIRRGGQITGVIEDGQTIPMGLVEAFQRGIATFIQAALAFLLIEGFTPASKLFEAIGAGAAAAGLAFGRNSGFVPGTRAARARRRAGSPPLRRARRRAG